MRRAVLLGLVCGTLMLSGCGDELEDSERSTDAGPLALVPDPEGSETALATGTMRIDGGCVSLLEAGSEPVTLVWPEGRTTWIAADQAIEFTDLSGETVVVHDGDRVELGGGGDSVEDGRSNDAWLAAIAWVSPPHGDCVFGSRWFVGQVDVLS